MPDLITSAADRDAEFSTALRHLLAMGEVSVNALHAFDHFSPAADRLERSLEVREKALDDVQGALNATRKWLEARMDEAVPAAAAPMSAEEWVERVSHDAAQAAHDETGVAPQLLGHGVWRAARDALSVRVATFDEAADRKWCSDLAQDAARRAGANAKVEPDILLPAFLRTVETLSGLEPTPEDRVVPSM